MLDSYLDLLIFADVYSAHQLRDNLLTAMLGQASSWFSFPDPGEELLNTAYENLPSSAKFIRFLALSAALVWLPDPDEDAVKKSDCLWRWNASLRGRWVMCRLASCKSVGLVTWGFATYLMRLRLIRVWCMSIWLLVGSVDGG